MKKGRAILGFLLSFIFLGIFVYAISGVQYLFTEYASKLGNEKFSASVSGSMQDDTTGNITGNPQKISAGTASEPEINAESVISLESNLSNADKILLNKNSQEKLPIASLTKLMTAVIALDNYDLSKNITVDSAADSQDALKLDVKLGDTMPAESFLEIMLVESSNKSAYTLSELMGEQKFVNLMNKKAKDIGMESTYFYDPTGLSAQNVSTANDLAKLAEYILKNYPRIGEISGSKAFYVQGFGEVSNTDQLLGEIPDIVCSKTGFTDAANGCLLLVINNAKDPKGDPDYLINIILGADDRFSEMKKLINWSSSVCN